jgi:copper resistance protein D
MLIWLHLLAAVAWVGGMLFLSLILVPELKRQMAEAPRALLFRAVARRFRLLVWGAIALLLMTGPVLLLSRVPSLIDPSTWPIAARVKLSLVAALLFAVSLHDFWLGPKVGRLKARPDAVRSPADQLALRLAPWIGRGVLLLALMVLLAAVILARS